MPKKIHYKHPGKQFAICDKAGHNPDLRIDIKAVTCQTCQKMVTGKTWDEPIADKNPVGRPSSPDGRHKVTFAITDLAHANLQAIPLGDRSLTVSNFLEGLDQPVGDKNVVGSGSGKDSV